MDIPRFLCDYEVSDLTALSSATLTLNEEESHHAIRVLRLEDGSHVEIINGKGWIAHGQVIQTDPRRCKVHIGTMEKGEDALPASIHIAMAPPKNMARIEWFLEKATEIGISRITPLQCQRSERVHINQERMEKIIRGALKQSRRTYLPLLSPLTPFPAFLARSEGICLIAHLDPLYSKPIKDVSSCRENITVLIGPEGDFSPEEIKTAMDKGCRMVSLGSSRLRTETAALMACAVLNMINGQL